MEQSLNICTPKVKYHNVKSKECFICGRTMIKLPNLNKEYCSVCSDSPVPSIWDMIIERIESNVLELEV